MRLVAAQDQRAWRTGFNCIQRSESCMDGSGDSVLPAIIDHGNRMVQGDGSANDLAMGAEYGEHGSGAGLVGQPDRALEQCFSAEHEQLFGLTEAAAGSGGKNDGGDRGFHGRPSASDCNTIGSG